MKQKSVLLIVSIVALAAVNIAAYAYISFLGLFVTAASYPLAENILKSIEGQPNKLVADLKTIQKRSKSRWEPIKRQKK